MNDMFSREQLRVAYDKGVDAKIKEFYVEDNRGLDDRVSEETALEAYDYVKYAGELLLALGVLTKDEIAASQKKVSEAEGKANEES